MSIYLDVKRFLNHSRQHGVLPSLKKLKDKIHNSMFQGKTILFYVDLADLNDEEYVLPKYIRVIHKESKEQISVKDIDKIISYRGRYIDATDVTRELDNRFVKGSRVWLNYYHGKLSGYIWSIRGGIVSPYFFPVPPNDAVLFDMDIFPEFRGQGLNSIIIKYILSDLKRNGFTRTYIKTQVWNKSSLRSLAKTHFKHYGTIRMFHILGKDITVWH